jgi:hypothetical protein
MTTEACVEQLSRVLGFPDGSRSGALLVRDIKIPGVDHCGGRDGTEKIKQI